MKSGNNRNIKLGLFGWYEKGAMEKIETLPFKQQAGCKLIYIAICSFSAKQKNTANIECYKFDIARFASVSEKTVQRYLPELERLGIISVPPQDRLSSGKYQKAVITLRQNNLPVGHIEESCEKVVGKLLDTKSDIYKESKETKERKKDLNSETFEFFWKMYPKKKAKPKAFEYWKKLDLDESLFRKIITTLNSQMCSAEWQKDGGRFIPYPQRWINEQRWLDEDVPQVQFDKPFNFNF